MATKAAHTQFNRSVAAYLESIGAETKGKSSFNGDWILKTVAGDLRVSVHEPEREDVFSIYCEFEDAKNNIVTSAFNYHSYDANELLNDFKIQMSSLLPVIA